MNPASRRSYLRVAFVAGTIAAAIGCYEEVAPKAWNHFAVYTLGEPAYSNNVMHVPPPLGMLNVEHQQALAGHIVTRVGSVFFNPLFLGFYLLLLLGLAANLAVRGRARPPTFVVIALAAVAVLATITRSAVIGAVIVLLCALRPQRLLRARWQRSRKTRFAIVVVVGLVLLSPVVVATGVSQRTSASLSGGQDASGHTSALVEGSQSLLSYPLGRGIGTAPGVGSRFGVSGQITAENSYLQVGDELGIPALVIFVALLFLVIRRLGRAEDADDDNTPLAGGLKLAAIALAVAGMFLHVWIEPSLAMTFWGGAGFVLGIAERMRTLRGHHSMAVPRELDVH